MTEISTRHSINVEVTKNGVISSRAKIVALRVMTIFLALGSLVGFACFAHYAFYPSGHENWGIFTLAMGFILTLACYLKANKAINKITDFN